MLKDAMLELLTSDTQRLFFIVNGRTCAPVEGDFITTSKASFVRDPQEKYPGSNCTSKFYVNFNLSRITSVCRQG